jgi:hypothetical protein
VPQGLEPNALEPVITSSECECGPLAVHTFLTQNSTAGDATDDVYLRMKGSGGGYNKGELEAIAVVTKIVTATLYQLWICSRCLIMSVLAGRLQGLHAVDNGALKGSPPVGDPKDHGHPSHGQRDHPRHRHS